MSAISSAPFPWILRDAEMDSVRVLVFPSVSEITHFNRISRVDPEHSLKALTELNLAHNDLTDMPVITGCPHLLTLKVRNERKQRGRSRRDR